MIGDRQRIARYHSDFYRDNYHKMLRLLIMMGILMVVLIAGIIYYILFTPAPKYYATTTSGLIIPMVVQSE